MLTVNQIILAVTNNKDMHMTIKKDELEIKIYEVIDEQLHKYSTTGVRSVGGGNGVSSSVSSVITHYSDQRLWLRDLESGKERQMEHDKFNVSARPGHHLVYVTYKPKNRIERIINLETEQVWSGGGEFETWSNRSKGMMTSGGRIFGGVLPSFLIFIPMFSALFFLTNLFMYVLPGQLGLRVKTNSVRLPGLASMGVHALMTLYTISWFQDIARGTGDTSWWVVAGTAVVVCSYLKYNILTHVAAALLGTSNTIDKFVDDQVSEFKLKYNLAVA